jgi:hypothetical protein
MTRFIALIERLIEFHDIRFGGPGQGFNERIPWLMRPILFNGPPFQMMHYSDFPWGRVQA